MLSGTLFWISWTALFEGLYLLLAGNLSQAEILVGAGVAILAGSLLTLARRLRLIRFRPKVRWLVPFLRLPAATLHESWMLMAALFRQVLRRRRISGFWVEVPYQGGGDDGRSSARRALTTLGVTFTPNDYVVSIAPGRTSVLIRQLVEGPLSVSDLAFLWLD